jgi:two-component SAPR family response regulator
MSWPLCAVDYVMKPFSPARLATTIGRLKDKAGTAPANLEGLLQTLIRNSAPKEHLRWITASQGQELRRDLLLPGGQQVHAGRHARSA